MFKYCRHGHKFPYQAAESEKHMAVSECYLNIGWMNLINLVWEIVGKTNESCQTDLNSEPVEKETQTEIIPTSDESSQTSVLIPFRFF